MKKNMNTIRIHKSLSYFLDIHEHLILEPIIKGKRDLIPILLLLYMIEEGDFDRLANLSA